VIYFLQNIFQIEYKIAQNLDTNNAHEKDIHLAMNFHLTYYHVLMYSTLSAGYKGDKLSRCNKSPNVKDEMIADQYVGAYTRLHVYTCNMCVHIHAYIYIKYIFIYIYIYVYVYVCI
jgi:hypothetical protein